MGKFASKMLANIQTSNTTCTSAISFSNNLTGYSSDHSLTFQRVLRFYLLAHMKRLAVVK